MLRADVNQFTTLSHQLLAHVRLSATTCDRLVAQDQSLVKATPIRHSHEEPLTLADKGLVRAVGSASAT